MKYRIPREYYTISDELVYKLKDKKVRIYGSLAQVFHNLLDEAFHNKEESKIKRSTTDFDNENAETTAPRNILSSIEEHIDLDIPKSVIEKIENDNLTSIYITYQDEIDKIEEGICKDLEEDNKVILITEHPDKDIPLDKLKEMHKKLVSIENRVLNKDGYVYRVTER